jgi:hypothetical protein
MANYFNGKILEPKKDGNALESMYYTGLREVEELFNRFRKPKEKEAYLIFSRDFKKVYNDKKTSYKPCPPMAISLRANIYDNQMGSVQVRFSDAPPEVGDNNKLVWPSTKNKSIIGETLAVSEKEKDYAWFLLKAARVIDKGMLKLVDEKAEYEGKFSSIQKQMAASRAIFDTDATMDSILAIAALVLPKGMEVNGDTKETVATRFWDMIVKGEETHQSYNYEAVINASRKLQIAEAKAVKESDETPLHEVHFENGDTLVVPLVKCPYPTKTETLESKAEEFHFSTEGLTRDEIYSVAKFKMQQMQNEESA